MHKAFANLTDTDRLIVGLDPFTFRDLANNPPGDTETMQHLGLSPTNLDRLIRSWINRTFLEPRGKRVLISGAIKSSTTWKQLKDSIK